MIPLSIQHIRRCPRFTFGLCLTMAAVFAIHTASDIPLIPFFGLVPVRMWSVESWSLLGPVEQLIPWFSYPLLHGSLLHLLGNLWGLWVFGSAVEGAIRPMRMFGLWVLTSWASAATYVLLDPDHISPLIGASGSVAGMVGYCCVHPRGTKVKAWVPWRPLRTNVRQFMAIRHRLGHVDDMGCHRHVRLDTFEGWMGSRGRFFNGLLHRPFFWDGESSPRPIAV